MCESVLVDGYAAQSGVKAKERLARSTKREGGVSSKRGKLSADRDLLEVC